MSPKNPNGPVVPEAPGLPGDAAQPRPDPLLEDGATSGSKMKLNTSPNAPGPEDYNEVNRQEKNTLEQNSLAILNNAVFNGGDEDIFTAEQAARDAQYDALGRKLLGEERERGIIGRRAMQATINTAFTEMRLHDLESQLRQVRIDLYKLPEGFELKTPKKKHPIFQHVLLRSFKDKFDLRRDMMQIPSGERPALEALVVEQLEAHVDPGLPNKETIGQSKIHLIPKRLRIRSRPLIAHLQQVTRTPITHDVSPHYKELEQPSITFLRPFKLLVTYEEEIRQSLRDLENKIESLSPQQKVVPRKEDVTKTFNDEDLLQDLKLLVNFMDEDLRPTFDLRRRIKDGNATEIEYSDLWHLFRYGDLALVSSDKSHAYRVLNFTGGREIQIDRLEIALPPPPGLDGFTIDCLSIKFDGINYVPQLDKFCIHPFSGSRPITSLPVYPLRFDKDRESIKRDLSTQGRLYLDLTIPSFSHRHLLGSTLDDPPHDIDAQVIIDTSMALSRMPEWRPRSDNVSRDQLTEADKRETLLPPYCMHSRYSEGCCGSDIGFKDHEVDVTNVDNFIQRNIHMLSNRKAADLEEEDLMLLPNGVHGFVLRSRQWVTLRVTDVSKVRFPNSFEDLMLPERHKSTIQALVQVHENTVTKTGNTPKTIGSSIDLVKGKGAGLILLLHGEPGVGKTSTAECVADHTKRPLFPITCGDIGETATEVEGNLDDNFLMAHKWGCVLLLDEADVFLAKRNKTDLRRNAVTSVFLRSLEYYAGILFLTTNRVGSIDPAFKSRIHISLFYPRFDLEATLKLYSTYIKRTRDEQDRLQSATFKIKEKEILRFAKRHFRQGEKEGLGTWNGRQIRNAFQAAIALAEYDSQQTKEGDPRPTLGEAQFKIVAESSREFDRYLVSTLGAADSDIARREEWRFDRFGHPEPKQPAMPQSYQQKNVGFYSSKNDETDDDDDLSSDDDDDDDDNDSSDGDDLARRRSGKKAQAAAKNDDREREQAEEFQEYLKWKNARKSGKGRY
ncbi:hypothetical protein O1611_g3918 [Lasiodiplodia mahajangana]|uniref:Uncharacterized protein n=1 Tax=Lasiodiplodia mahajangana TaxID=1108764 RepID=A0ACC2JQD4_9PEZI|nr:hypothetical protein O1611_g3918 [Lasiodiplodia mahajangana]